MAHMQLATWVGEHRQAEEFFFAAIFNNAEAVIVAPPLLDFGFDLIRMVFVLHECSVVLGVKNPSRIP
jgi:hypothetical protein